MFGIELTTGQKAQIGFVASLLAIAIYLFVHNTRPLMDTAVNAWTISHKRPIDIKKPIGPDNPVDPTKEEITTVFACADGKLEITEYRNDPDRHPVLHFIPETRRGITNYVYYQDPMAPVEAITDPYRHALALAAYSYAMQNKKLGILGNANLTADQLKTEAAARQVMMDAIKVLQASVDLGTFHPDMMAKVMKALADYLAKDGDPREDSAKADLARKVLECAANFLKALEAQKDVAVDAYIDKIDAMLTAEQKAALVAAENNLPPALAAPSRRGNRGRGNRGATATDAPHKPVPAVPSRAGQPPVARGTALNRGGTAGSSTQPAPAGK